MNSEFEVNKIGKYLFCSVADERDDSQKAVFIFLKIKEKASWNNTKLLNQKGKKNQEIMYCKQPKFSRDLRWSWEKNTTLRLIEMFK